MTQQEIQERNKQIALMLGYKPNKHNNGSFDDFYDEPQLYVSDLKFHSDWNWLMEAVEFVESRGYEIDIFANCVEICITPDEDYVSEAVGKTKKEAVFTAVSDFAKLFNNKEI